MYGIIRMAFWGIITVYLANRSARKANAPLKTKKILLLVGIWMVVSTASNLFPLENYLFSFKTPEAVFRYTHVSKIVDVVYGKDSSLIVYAEDKSTFGHYIVPKAASGYKIPTALSSRTIRYSSEGGFLKVYNVKDTNDNYLMGMTSYKGKGTNVIDANNNRVKFLDLRMKDWDIGSIIVYSYVENIPEEYFVQINDEKIILKDSLLSAS